MDCPKVRDLLSDLVDGELADGVAAEVRDHLLGCEPCAALARDLRRVADAAAELPPLEPPPEQWDRIEARLDAVTPLAARPRGGRLGRAAFVAGIGLAAAAAAALVVTLRTPRPVDRSLVRPGDGLVLAAATDEVAIGAGERLPDDVLLADAQREFRIAEEHYLKATERLAALVARERGERPFSPALAAAFDRNLKVIDEAIARCRDLARGAPDDPWAQEVLYAAYARKLRFLEDLLRSRTREEAP